MGQNSKEPVYTGLDKYPGTISTVVTILITGLFVGALYIQAAPPFKKMATSVTEFVKANLGE